MIIINGEQTEINDGTTVAELICEKGFRPNYIAVELNGEILKKDLYSSVILKDGDKLEVVSFVGGG